MQMSGSRQIAASQAEVWRKLNDPETLARCIPGCESLEKTSDTNMKGVVALKLGPMALRFNGDVELSNLNPPNSYRLSGSGKAGPAGFASGFADVKLEPKDGGTLLSYNVESTVGGRMAQLGARLIDATAAQLAGQFFDKFAAEVAPAAAAAAAMSGPAPAVQKSSGGIPAWSWVVLGLIVLAALYFLFAWGH
jgi:uncharacterized protein